MRYLEQYPGWVHTEAQGDLILASEGPVNVPRQQIIVVLITKPLLYCVELMARIIHLIEQPALISGIIFARMTMTSSRDGKSAWQSEKMSWESLFSQVVATHTLRDEDLPTLRVLSVLLLSNPLYKIIQELSLEGAAAGNLGVRLVWDRYMRLLSMLEDNMYPRIGQPERLTNLANTSDDTLLQIYRTW
ncbi:hypothetical protein BU23DRAFT_236935 [Bimuria novae-zelandiae CBS 107.79]|uniref:Uncharacterized protein n=1 Tax=Bimuria novae-zelandiae CBS 107.79 TaxID=1447943 RepID=A0A6A5V3E2_9PLEO|nr:hypothetical protein BU23DRAFT_236935 [Bimuria novae-zelandiae CBS 107.79]